MKACTTTGNIQCWEASSITRPHSRSSTVHIPILDNCSLSFLSEDDSTHSVTPSLPTTNRKKTKSLFVSTQRRPKSSVSGTRHIPTPNNSRNLLHCSKPHPSSSNNDSFNNSGQLSSINSRGTSSTAFSIRYGSTPRPISQVSEPFDPQFSLIFAAKEYNQCRHVSPSLPLRSLSLDVKSVALMHLQRCYHRSSVSRASSITSELEPIRSSQELRRVFHSAIRVVIVVVRICASIRKYIDKPETLKELNHYSKEYEFSANALTFSKSFYFKSSGSSVPLWARNIMEMDPLNSGMESSTSNDDGFTMVTPPLIPSFTESFGLPTAITGTTVTTSVDNLMPTTTAPGVALPTDEILNTVYDKAMSDLSCLLLPSLQPTSGAYDPALANAFATGQIGGNELLFHGSTNGLVTPSSLGGSGHTSLVLAAGQQNQYTVATHDIPTQQPIVTNNAELFTPSSYAYHNSSVYSSYPAGDEAIIPPSSTDSYLLGMEDEVESTDSGEGPVGVEGGYDYEFLQARTVEDEDLVCPICKFVSREPQQSECCGKVFCTVCINRLKRSRSFNSKCPNCREEPVSLFIDKRSSRSIFNLLVYCKRKRKGCLWTGTLSDIDSHLQQCRHQRVACSNGCGKRVQRKHVDKHIKRFCPNRTVQCQDCKEEGQWTYITGEHVEKCPCRIVNCTNEGCSVQVNQRDLQAHLTDCPRKLIPCSYNDIGCNVLCRREEMVTHEREFVSRHLNTAVKMARVFTSSSYGDHLLQVSPVIIRIPNYNGCDARSQPFLTSVKGYKMCIHLMKKAECVEFYFSLMSGLYDSSLSWPFRGKIVLLLMNQKEDENHHKMSVCLPTEMGVARVIDHHDDISNDVLIGKVPLTGMASSSSCTSELESLGYLVEDVLCMRFTYERARKHLKRKKSSKSSKRAE